MTSILRVKDVNGNWVDIPAIVGPQGPQGPKGNDATYTLPIASADTLGGVKVGKGLVMDGDALGVEKLSQIKTVSLDSDTAEVVIDLDSEGKPFNLEEAEIICKFPRIETNRQAKFYVYSNGLRVVGREASNVLSMEESTLQIHLKEENERVNVDYRSGGLSTYIYNVQDSARNTDNMNGNFKFQLLVSNTDNPMPKGSTIKLYGRRRRNA